jgi:hypothetical protein
MATDEQLIRSLQHIQCERGRPPHESAAREPEREPTSDIGDVVHADVDTRERH